jgi:hypothetical protein
LAETSRNCRPHALKPSLFFAQGFVRPLFFPRLIPGLTWQHLLSSHSKKLGANAVARLKFFSILRRVYGNELGMSIASSLSARASTAKMFSSMGRLRGWTVFVVALTLALRSFGEVTESPRERLLMDFNWRFHLGDDWGTCENLAKAGENPGPAGRDFSDAAWRKINLPHDWVPELPFDSTAAADHGFKPVGPGFHSNSVGWYRKTFDLPASDTGRRLMLEFDGVFRNCTVFINGYLIGRHQSGYSSFRYDISDLANCGGHNTLSVRVDASEFEGWF